MPSRLSHFLGTQTESTNVMHSHDPWNIDSTTDTCRVVRSATQDGVGPQAKIRERRLQSPQRGANERDSFERMFRRLAEPFRAKICPGTRLSTQPADRGASNSYADRETDLITPKRQAENSPVDTAQTAQLVVIAEITLSMTSYSLMGSLNRAMNSSITKSEGTSSASEVPNRVSDCVYGSIS